jgi:hypothetical protein
LRHLIRSRVACGALTAGVGTWKKPGKNAQRQISSVNWHFQAPVRERFCVGLRTTEGITLARPSICVRDNDDRWLALPTVAQYSAERYVLRKKTSAYGGSGSAVSGH